MQIVLALKAATQVMNTATESPPNPVSLELANATSLKPFRLYSSLIPACTFFTYESASYSQPAGCVKLFKSLFRAEVQKADSYNLRNFQL